MTKDRASCRGKRKDLADGHLRGLVAAAIALIACFLVMRPLLPMMFQKAGTPLMQSVAIVGALMLLSPFAYLVAKRGGFSDVPNRWLIAHIVASLIGVVLVVMHSGGALLKWPSFMLYALAGLVATGATGRLGISRQMAATLGSKQAAFALPDPGIQKRLRRIIGQKSSLLAKLDPAASEATFSVALRHWLTKPMLALRYAGLARQEAMLIGARGSVGSVQAWWRVFHLTLAALFLGALFAHVITVTFFAGYVAGGREIYWWHLARW